MPTRPQSLLEGSGVFVLCLAISAAFSLGTIYLVSDLRSRLNRTEQSRVARSLAPQDFARALQDGLLTGDECAASLRALPTEDVTRFLAQQETAFWKTNSNAEMLVRQAARLSAERTAPKEVMSNLRHIFVEHGLDSFTTSRLLGSALSGILEHRAVDREGMVALLQESGPEQATSLLEMWFDFQRGGSVSSDSQLATEIAAGAFAHVDAALRKDLARMVMRVWAHRAPPAADVVLYVAKLQSSPEFDDKFRADLLCEGANWFEVANPEECQRRLAEFAGKIPMEKVAERMAASGMSFEQAQKTAAGMPEDNRDVFLTAFLNSVYEEDPRVMEKIARSCAIKDLPKEASAKVLGGLLLCGDFTRAEAWLQDADAKTKAGLLDRGLASSIGAPSGGAVRFYLKERSPGIADLLRMPSALITLPDEELEQFLRGRVDLSEKDRTNLGEQITEARMDKAYSGNVEDLPKYLAMLPAEKRGDLFRMYTAQMMDKSAVRRWIEESPDPVLRGQMQSGLIVSEANMQSLDAAETDLRAALASGQDPKLLAPAIRMLVSQRSHTDPASAATLVESLPSASRDEATTVLMSEWGSADPAAAAAWIGTQPAGAGRDYAILSLVHENTNDPEDALANAAAIADPRQRLQGAGAVLRLWRDADPARAAAALSAAGFSDEELALLQRFLRVNPAAAATP